MFIYDHGIRYDDGTPVVNNQKYMVLFAKGQNCSEVFGIVRTVRRMSQVGQFMMGAVQVGPKRIIVSGAFGGDGHPIFNHEKFPPDKFWHKMPHKLNKMLWDGDWVGSVFDRTILLRLWGEVLDKNTQTSKDRLQQAMESMEMDSVVM